MDVIFATASLLTVSRGGRRIYDRGRISTPPPRLLAMRHLQLLGRTVEEGKCEGGGGRPETKLQMEGKQPN